MRAKLYLTILVLLGTPLFAAPHRVYAMGDSLTFVGGYEARLQELLGPGWEIVNLGKGGDWTEGMAARFKAQVIDPGDADLVIVFGGVNDIISNTPASAVIANLRVMYALSHAARIPVVAVTVLPFRGHERWTPYMGKQIDTVNDWILRVPSAEDLRDGAFADFTVNAAKAMSKDRALLPKYAGPDHLHLSPAGYSKVGEVIYDALTATKGMAGRPPVESSSRPTHR